MSRLDTKLWIQLQCQTLAAFNVSIHDSGFPSSFLIVHWVVGVRKRLMKLSFLQGHIRNHADGWTVAVTGDGLNNHVLRQIFSQCVILVDSDGTLFGKENLLSGHHVRGHQSDARWRDDEMLLN